MHQFDTAGENVVKNPRLLPTLDLTHLEYPRLLELEFLREKLQNIGLVCEDLCRTPEVYCLVSMAVTIVVY